MIDFDNEDFSKYRTIDWKRLCMHNQLSEDFIEKYKDKVDWSYISEYQFLSEDFIRKYKDYVNFEEISKNQKLSEQFIREFSDKVDWHYISWYQKLSEDFILEFLHKIHLEGIACCSILSEEFLINLIDSDDRIYIDYCFWGAICEYQKLSINFIEKYKNIIDWDCFGKSEFLTKEIIIKYIDDLDLSEVLRNKSLDEYIKNYIRMFI